MKIYKDNETKITHIICDYHTLCGLCEGWTRKDVEPVKKQYGINCQECIDEIKEIKKLKQINK